jgi:hypothetical protein
MPGEPIGMPGTAKAANVRPHGQELANRPGGDMVFNDEAVDFGRMARSQCVRHSKTRLDTIELRGFGNAHLEAIPAQMIHPCAAAAAVWVPVDGDAR